MNLTNEQDLKIYFFAGEAGKPPSLNTLQSINSFSLEEAMAKLEKRNNYFYKYIGNITAEQMLKTFQNQTPEIKNEELPVPEIKDSKELFLAKLKLTANEYVKDEKQQKALNKIIIQLEKEYATQT